MKELAITSPYVHSRVDSNTFIHLPWATPYARVDLNPMPELTLSPSQGLWIWLLGTCMMRQVPTTFEERSLKMRLFFTGAEQKLCVYINIRWAIGISYELSESQANCTSCSNGFLSNKLSPSPIKIYFTQIVIRGVRIRRPLSYGFFWAGFRIWIRIRIGSVFNRTIGSGSIIWIRIRIRIQEGKNDPQK